MNKSIFDSEVKTVEILGQKLDIKTPTTEDIAGLSGNVFSSNKEARTQALRSLTAACVFDHETGDKIWATGEEMKSVKPLVVFELLPLVLEVCGMSVGNFRKPAPKLSGQRGRSKSRRKK